jgi:hypothetical protein
MFSLSSLTISIYGKKSGKLPACPIVSAEVETLSSLLEVPSAALDITSYSIYTWSIKRKRNWLLMMG